MTNVELKFRRTQLLCALGKFPRTFGRAWDTIPDRLKTELTSRQLALVIEVDKSAFDSGRASAVRDALAERCLWDQEAGRLREID